jgi:hypothetical protein
MIIEAETELGRKTVIKTENGKIVSNAKKFNTETKEAVLYAMVMHDDGSKNPAIIGSNLFNGDRNLVTFTCHLLGYNAYNKETGEQIK